ncbi:N-acetyl-gamma-glutamyl-phosphate reductase [Hyphobacterium marinum]|uniref:N-acetyl-gamma-glutamyl-phosphate reductase n=1 Tax=Hyphobacterium marinum TaxID=3116574 RepID=A0ABU7LWQ9_9PROT|nr:N-acetyl-gamma-glutamyl-phosphate reductase [Hyphobacterium sp. Y6023]MEE2565712.1 N-acetyl-gamma-glutamyl-phosphate reductase [Hyphobacterium sp. Y6023]
MTLSVGLVGARGHTGHELLRLIAARDDMSLAFASSRELDGQPVSSVAPEFGEGLSFEALDDEAVAARGADAVVLALPNGAAAPFVEAIDRSAPDTLIVDLSADYRFNDDWRYGLPELNGRASLSEARRIANPGCYATCGQVSIAPVRGLLAAPAHVFGVSGYSGAGTTPSRKNDTEALKDNLMPYALTGHIHEAEMTRHLCHEVVFTPHVAEFFRGLIVTSHLEFAQPVSSEGVRDAFRGFYEGEALIEIMDRTPEARDGAFQDKVLVGGFGVSEDGYRGVVVATLDNLLKGAAVQAVQNLAIASGLPEYVKA